MPNQQVTLVTDMIAIPPGSGNMTLLLKAGNMLTSTSLLKACAQSLVDSSPFYRHAARCFLCQARWRPTWRPA